MSTPSTNEPPVSITWLLFDPAQKVTVPRSIDIPASLYRKRSQESRNLFCRTLLQDFGIKVANANFVFWKPKELLLEDTASEPGWAMTIGEIRNIGKVISLIKSFANQLDMNNKDAVHLIVTIKSIYPNTVVTEHQEPSYPMYNRLQGIKANLGQAPSVAATSANYIKAQASENRAICDGRSPFYPDQKSKNQVATMAPPIQIFHPIFDKFLRYINDPPERLTREFLKATIGLMWRLSGIDSADSNNRNEDINMNLSRILGVTIAKSEASGRSLADGSHFFTVNNIHLPIIVVELKQEIGEGECDPSTQTAPFMRQSWLEHHMSVIRDNCCCPGFMIGGAGPWIGVSGSVMTDRLIVQRLTDLQWCGLSSTSEDARIYQFARTLNALRLCIGELQKYYMDIGATTNIKVPPHDPHPRYFPYPQSFTDEDDKIISFEYLRPLEEGEPTCVTFLAQTARKKIVVKFVSRYGADAHRFLAAGGHAPRLHYYGPLPDAKGIPTTFEYPGLSFGSMQMVVMDYISPCEPIPSDAKEQLRAILEKFHAKGYAFGDLREPNVIFDEEKKARLIDFDWAGHFDKTILDDLSSEPLPKKIKIAPESKNGDDRSIDSCVCYPLNTSMTVSWAAGVKPLGPIRPSHDLEMLTRLDL